jgi:hypothetical protein
MRTKRQYQKRRIWRGLMVVMFLGLLLPGRVAIGGHVARAQQTPTAPVPSSKTVNLELVFDSSGSMAEDLGGVTKIDAAKSVLNDVIDSIPQRPGINVGFRVFGHKGNNTEAGKAESCQSSDLLVPIKGVDKSKLKQQVATYQPTGWTPITLALQRAGGDFQPSGESISNIIVLVTDGEETCGGDPCAAAAALKKGNAKLTTYVVGFGTSPEQQAANQCIADQGGGKLLGANSAEELSAALFTVLQEVEVVPTTGFLEIESIGGLFPKAKITGTQGANDSNPNGTAVTIVLTTSNRVELDVGAYDVSWTNPSGEVTKIRVNIEADRTTWIRGSILEFPQGAGETYSVVDQSGVVIWRAPFELGDRVWVLPGIYRIDMVERVGDPILISAELQTLPGTVTKLEVLTAP